MIIEIQPDAIQLTTVKDGVRSTKMTNLRAIQEVLTKETALETPFMPGPWGTKKYTRKNERELTVFATPPHIRHVKYNMREEGIAEVRGYDIPIPGLVWFIHTIIRPGSDKRQYNNGMVCAVKDPLYAETQQLYQFPFSNVDDTWMCWGTMRGHVELGNLASLTSIPDRFMDMEFNNHLDHGNYTSFKHERKGNMVDLTKTSHLFEYLDEVQKAAHAQGKDSTFKNDILKKKRTFAEEVQHQLRHGMRG
jgi:hypothetical protein